jgi:hypothetical protein
MFRYENPQFRNQVAAAADYKVKVKALLEYADAPLG